MQCKVAGALVAVLAALMTVGCGGSKSDVTKSAFAQRVTAVCAHYEHQGLVLNKQAMRQVRANGGKIPAALRSQVYAKVATYRQQALDALKKIIAPANLQAAYAEWQGLFPPAPSKKYAEAAENSPVHLHLRAIAQKRLRLAAKLDIKACG